MTHICISNLANIGSDNGLSPGQRQAIIWTNAGILLIRPWGTNFSEILFENHTFSFNKMCSKLSSAKWRPFCLGLNVLRDFQHHWSFTQQNPMTFAHKGVVITKLWYFTCSDQTINFLACEINFFAFYSPQQGLDWWSRDLLCPFIFAYRTQFIEVWHPYNSGMGPHWLR